MDEFLQIERDVMSGLQQVLEAVEGSHADAGKKAVLEAFLARAATVIDVLGPSMFQQIMQAASTGSVPGVVVEQLNSQQVAALLAQAGEDLAALSARHGAEVAAWKAALGQLEAAALAAVARALLGVL